MFKSLSGPNISDPKYAINAKIDIGISKCDVIKQNESELANIDLKL